MDKFYYLCQHDSVAIGECTGNLVSIVHVYKFKEFISRFNSRAKNHNFEQFQRFNERTRKCEPKLMLPCNLLEMPVCKAPGKQFSCKRYFN